MYECPECGAEFDGEVCEYCGYDAEDGDEDYDMDDDGYDI